MRPIIVLGALLFSSVGLSQESVEGPYLGIGLGALDFKYTVGPTPDSFSDNATAVKLYGGFRFNERWAVEGTYRSVSTVTGMLGGTAVSADYDSIGLRGLAHFGHLLVGIEYWNAGDVRKPAVFSGALPSNESDVALILGGEWSLNDDWGLRLEYELFDADSSSQSDASALSIGAHYKFGRR